MDVRFCLLAIAQRRTELLESKECCAFNRSGLASLSDLQNQGYKDIFSLLEKEQNTFLQRDSEFRSDEYKWPRDPLHDFSRVWEYPYVYFHLASHLKTLPSDFRPLVVDVGSGVTFFPFALARLGYRVVCADIDKICERDLALACQTVSQSPGSVDFRLIADSTLPFDDSSCDALYCISVLEHIPSFEKTLSEMYRILKPGGLCLITCDINLRAEDGPQLNSTQYARLMPLIDAYFERIHPERTVHPLDVLTTRNSPYPRKMLNMRVVPLVWHALKQKVLKPLVGRQSGRLNAISPHLGVLGLVLRKRL